MIFFRQQVGMKGLDRRFHDRLVLPLKLRRLKAAVLSLGLEVIDTD
jgi:hypothetical protein